MQRGITKAVAPAEARRGRMHPAAEAAPAAAGALNNYATPAAVGAVVSASLSVLPPLINTLSAFAGFIWLCVQIYQSPTYSKCVRRFRKWKKRR